MWYQTRRSCLVRIRLPRKESIEERVPMCLGRRIAAWLIGVRVSIQEGYMKRIQLIMLFFAIIAFAPSMRSSVRADSTVSVPYEPDPQKRVYVGMEYYSGGQHIVMTAGPMDLTQATEAVLRLRQDNLPLTEYDPNVVEVRQIVSINDLFPTHLPLLRIAWDADGDGKADFIAVKDGEHFRIFPFPKGTGPEMRNLWYFDDSSVAPKKMT